eukprot:6123846-Amphidinium_carterae.2
MSICEGENTHRATSLGPHYAYLAYTMNRTSRQTYPSSCNPHTSLQVHTSNPATTRLLTVWVWGCTLGHSWSFTTSASS